MTPGPVVAQCMQFGALRAAYLLCYHIPAVYVNRLECPCRLDGASQQPDLA